MTSLISTKTGEKLTDLDDPAVGLSIFRINTPFGWMWFTPGLAPGYRSVLVFMPCHNIVFSYAVSDAVERGGFHAYFISQIMHTLLEDSNIKEAIDQYSHTSSYPDYCRINIPSLEFQFPKFNHSPIPSR